MRMPHASQRKMHIDSDSWCKCKRKKDKKKTQLNLIIFPGFEEHIKTLTLKRD